MVETLQQETHTNWFVTESDDSYKTVPDDLVAQTLGRGRKPGIDPMLCAYQQLFQKLRLSRRGVIHLGGHIGQELPLYAALGFSRIVMVEPLEREYVELQRRIAAFNTTCAQVGELIGETPACAHAVRCAISDEAGPMKFYRTRISSLSSLARPIEKNFSDQWKDRARLLAWYKRPLSWWKTRSALRFSTVDVNCMTLDELLTTLPHGWRARDFSYLRMNIQGAELRALRGGETLLREIMFIDLEINIEERYQGTPSREEFDDFLSPRGFKRLLSYRVGPMGNLVYVRPM